MNTDKLLKKLSSPLTELEHTTEKAEREAGKLEHKASELTDDLEPLLKALKLPLDGLDPRALLPKPRKAHIDPELANLLVLPDIRNVIVLVTGESAPLFVEAEQPVQPLEGWGEYDPENPADVQQCAAFPTSYWSDHPRLAQALATLSERYANLHLFHVHGWSGDGSAESCRLAGEHLAKRLCMDDDASGKPAYYGGFRGEPLALHMIGHGQGGNLIHEFTRAAAALGAQWPTEWKVRSITYLSTPFFLKKHQLDTCVLDPACRMLSLSCGFDLTQRMAADLSLGPLIAALRHHQAWRVLEPLAVVKNKLGGKKYKELLQRAVHSGQLGARLEGELPVPSALVEVAPLYREIRDLLAALKAVLDRLQNLLTQLQKPVRFALSREVVGRVEESRVLVSSALAQRVDRQMAPLRKNLRTACARLDDTLREGGRVRLFELLSDLQLLSGVLQPLANFLTLQPGLFAGPLPELLADVLKEQHSDYENARITPRLQLLGTPYFLRLLEWDVSKHDAYRKDERLKEFGKFIGFLELAQEQYGLLRGRRELAQLALVLLAQLEPFREMSHALLRGADESPYAALGQLTGGVAEGALTQLLSGGPGFLGALQNLALALGNWAKVLSERDAGELCMPGTGAGTTPDRGSLRWFFGESHAITRRELYLLVAEMLKLQLTTRPRRIRRADDLLGTANRLL